MKKSSQRVLKICVSVLAFALVFSLFSFVFTPVTYGHWAVHDRKQLSGKIDTVIIGDSFPLYAVQPGMLDEAAECTSFNACSANQYLDKSYYILLDYIRTENIRTVFFGVDYYNFLKESENESLTSEQIVYKRLTDPKTKLTYLKEYLKINDVWSWLFSEKIGTEKFPEIVNNLKVKLSYEYRHYLPAPESGTILGTGTYYYDKGYVRTDLCNDSYSEGSFDMKNMSEKNIEWFEQILALCRDNNIDLVLFHTPVKQSRLEAVKNYPLFTDMINKKAAEYGFEFTDYNFYPSRAELSDELHFVNAAHLNYEGSTLFMSWLCRDLKNH